MKEELQKLIESLSPDKLRLLYVGALEFSR